MKIREIVGHLETRVDQLLKEFKALELSITVWQNNNPFIAMEDSDEIKPILNEMIDIFQELRPIEKLIRFKFKEYAIIFDKLGMILDERENGKFFAFLSHAPIKEKRPYNKRAALTVSPEGQTTLH